ncbi:hypothetical protein J6590_050984 [Homalodisca vitripennis]|nr:hypothetical protein J6590_050984 [Homalodisca vitripennis]
MSKHSDKYPVTTRYVWSPPLPNTRAVSKLPVLTHFINRAARTRHSYSWLTDYTRLNVWPGYSTPGQASVLTVTPVESDTRLLQFTDETLTVNNSLRVNRIVRAFTTVDCGIQCDLPLGPPVDSGLATVEFGGQCD